MPVIETPRGRPVYLGPFQRIVNVAWSIPKQAILSIDVPLDPADYNYIVSRFWVELRLDRPPLGEVSLGICGDKQPPGEYLIPYAIPYRVYDGTPTPWGSLNNGAHTPPQDKFRQAYIAWGDGVPFIDNTFGGKLHWFVNFARIKRAFPGTRTVKLIVRATWNDAYAEMFQFAVRHAITFKVYRNLRMDHIALTQRGEMTLPASPPPALLLSASGTYQRTVDGYDEVVVAEIEYDLKADLTMTVQN
jgi:hypothetical protein